MPRLFYLKCAVNCQFYWFSVLFIPTVSAVSEDLFGDLWKNGGLLEKGDGTQNWPKLKVKKVKVEPKMEEKNPTEYGEEAKLKIEQKIIGQNIGKFVKKEAKSENIQENNRKKIKMEEKDEEMSQKFEKDFGGETNKIRRITNRNDGQKKQLVEQFEEMRMPFQRAGAHSTREWMKIEREIAEKIGTSRTSIYRWKAQLGLTKKNTDENRRKMVNKYMKLKKSSLANGEAKSAQKVGEKCSKELGIHKRTIEKWKAKFGLNENRRYSDEEKRKIMAKYYQMKRENPRIMVKTVCKKLNISMATLYRWKGEIGEGQQKPEKATGEIKHQKFDNLNNCEKALCADGNGQNVWAWNLATGRRQRKTKLTSLY